LPVLLLPVFAVAFLVVIPEGDLLLFLPLLVLAVARSCRCSFLPLLVLAVASVLAVACSCRHLERSEGPSTKPSFGT
jgi:hypothetical protein